MEERAGGSQGRRREVPSPTTPEEKPQAGMNVPVTDTTLYRYPGRKVEGGRDKNRLGEVKVITCGVRGDPLLRVREERRAEGKPLSVQVVPPPESEKITLFGCAAGILLELSLNTVIFLP